MNRIDFADEAFKQNFDANKNNFSKRGSSDYFN